MDLNLGFLELKYGNIYGGPPNFFAISEVSLIVFEPQTKRIFVESLTNNADVDIVNVYTRADELGAPIEKVHEVVNMRTMRKQKYDAEFQLDERSLRYAFGNLNPFKRTLAGFFMKKFKKYRFRTLVIFDGRRDIFLCEKNGANFRGKEFFDLQQAIKNETDHLFSLNKLAKVTNFDLAGTYLRSTNEEYWLHPIAAKQIQPQTASFDAARMLMAYQEYSEHHDDFLIKAALLLNKIEQRDQDK